MPNHFHINHFGPDLPHTLLELKEEGFTPIQYQIQGLSEYDPLWIATSKKASDDNADDLFNKILEKISADKKMYGYIEYEKIFPGSVTRFQENQLLNTVDFPIPTPEFAHLERKADIHIFRDIQTPYDNLDEQLRNTGFFEVKTPTERVWTLLMGDTEDADRTYDYLVEYFKNSGGISKLEKEIIQRIAPTPRDFPMRPVTKPNFYKK